MFPLVAIIMISFRLNFHQSLSDFKKKKIIYYLWYRTTAMTYETWVIYQAYGVGLGGENCLDLLHIYIYIYICACVCVYDTGEERKPNQSLCFYISLGQPRPTWLLSNTLWNTHSYIYSKKKLSYQVHWVHDMCKIL